MARAKNSGRLIPAYAGKTPSARKTPSTPEAHPRVCGENLSRPPARSRGSGSSPRMRGKLYPRMGNVWNSGLIPAYAGKTCLDSQISKWTRAHPRVCGENYLSREQFGKSAGSSPRMRGKPHGQSSLRSRRRLIPAYAGKTADKHSPTLLHGAHPRVCGENARFARWVQVEPGSSPRMRGKRR